MSPQEEACRWTLVQAYCCWRLAHHGGQIGMLSYARALGLEPTDPPRACDDRQEGGNRQ